jgi:hypothetical protein
MSAYDLKHRNLGTLLALLVSTSLVGWCQESPNRDILTRLQENPERLHLAVEARNAGKVEEATVILMDALRKGSCTQPSPSSALKCGPLAWGLQALDPDSRTGENYLVRPVEAFLAERVPPPFRDEAAAEEIKFAPEYEAWWKANGLSPNEGAAWENMYGSLLHLAAFIGDPKLEPLFRRGLQSNASFIVVSSIRGLALLHDKQALPEILAAIERLKYLGEGGLTCCFPDSGITTIRR